MQLADEPVLQRDGEVFRRHPANPILTPDAWPYPANAVFNPAAVQMPSGETVLLCRVEDYRGFSHLTVARSADGYTDWHIDSSPTLLPDPSRPEEEWGLEDARVVWVEEIGAFAVTCTAYSRNGPLVTLMLTEDFKTFERKGPIVPPDDKNAALFPVRFDGRWAMLHRPMTSRADHHGHVWISHSPDLKHWADPCSVLSTRSGPYWDNIRMGIASPPIETDEGWLLMYHGVRKTVSGDLYRVGACMLDRDNPCKVVKRSGQWLIGPSAPYERVGDVPNVVFPCGHVLDRDADELRIYYGAADTCIGVATASFSGLLDWLDAHDTMKR
jgi:predicted GH43/DUF377 family glycosyl hydrolase